MILAYLLLFTGLTISSVAIYYSVVGLTAIFSAAAVPIMIMGVSLEVAKLVCATWIKQHWAQVPRLMKIYMCVAITVLMLITSMGIFGFLSKAHNDQNLVSGDVGAKLAIYDEKIKTARDNIEADRKQLRQMDDAVDQVMARSTNEQGADKSVAIRRSQAKDRATIAKDIEANQRVISQLNDEAAPIRAENRKVEAEVGPIKYIAAFIYGTAPDASMLEKAVTWIIIMIVVVFDPLAVIMLLAAQMTFVWEKKQIKKDDKPVEEPVDNTDEDEYEGVRLPNGEWIQTGPKIGKVAKDYKADDGALTDDQITQINAMLAEYAEHAETLLPDPVEEPVLITRVADPESDALSSPYIPDENFKDIIAEPNPLAMDERPGDYVEQPPVVANPEAAPGRNRGIMNTHLLAEADNNPTLGKATNNDFGNAFPTNPSKGDTYLRTDYLPNRLFKFNDYKWIEVDKNSTDVYAYEEAYIKHLIEEIEAGRYDADSLTDVEREQIKEYLGKNAQ